MQYTLLKTFLFINILYPSMGSVEDICQVCSCFQNEWKINVNCYDYNGDFPLLPINTTSLSLRYSKFDKLPDYAFKNNHVLEKVSISYSTLSEIEERAFHGAKTLKSVELIGNKFKRLKANVFRRMKSLRSLILLRNELKTIDYGFLGGTSMKLVKIGYNHLDEIRRDIFIDSAIEELIISNSSKLIMTNGEFFQWMRNSIRKVSFSNVPMILPKNRLSFKNLRLDELVLRNVGLTDLSELNGLSSKKLDISHNRINWNTAKSSNFSVDSVKCEKTSLKDLHLLSLAFPKSKALYASYNEIESIPSQGLVGLFPLMTEVDFSNNLLTKIYPRDISSLEKVSLSYCKLRTIYNNQHNFPKTMLDLLNNGLVLKFSGNQLHCNCEMKWFYEYLKMKQSYAFFTTQCRTPFEKRFIQVKETEFNCLKPKIESFTYYLMGRSSVRLTCEASGDPLPIVQIHFREDYIIKPEKIAVRYPDAKFKRNRLSVVYTRDNRIQTEVIAYCVAHSASQNDSTSVTLTSLLGLKPTTQSPTTTANATTILTTETIATTSRDMTTQKPIETKNSSKSEEKSETIKSTRKVTIKPSTMFSTVTTSRRPTSTTSRTRLSSPTQSNLKGISVKEIQTTEEPSISSSNIVKEVTQKSSSKIETTIGTFAQKTTKSLTTAEIPSLSRDHKDSTMRQTESTTGASSSISKLTPSASTMAPPDRNIPKIKVSVEKNERTEIFLSCKSYSKDNLKIEISTSQNKSQMFYVGNQLFSLRSNKFHEITFFSNEQNLENPQNFALLENYCPSNCACDDLTINCPVNKEQPLDKIPAISSNTPFRKLIITKGNLGNINSESFKNYENFNEIVLSKCNLRQLHKDTFSRLLNLKTIKIWNNDDLKEIPEDIFKQNKKLKTISLSANGIVKLPKNLVKNLNLDTLDLRSLQLVSLDHNVFANSSMKHLFLGNNQKLINWNPTKFVGLLNVSHLAINLIPLSSKEHELDFSKLRAMERLEMSKTNISIINFLDGVRTTDVILNHNNFENLPLHPNIDWSDIKYCNITHSKLKSIDQLPDMPLVHHLNLRGNAISHLNQFQISEKFPKLEVFVLTSNKIALFDTNILAGMGRQLRSLYLDSNQLTTLPRPKKPIDKIWPAMEYLDLTENYFTCDCELDWFYKWSFGNNAIRSPYCLIKSNEVRLLTAMPEETFVCEQDSIIFNYTLDDEGIEIRCGNSNNCTTKITITIDEEGYFENKRTSLQGRGSTMVSYEFSQNTYKLILKCDAFNAENSSNIISQTRTINIRSKSTFIPEKTPSSTLAATSTTTTRRSTERTSVAQQPLKSSDDDTDYSTIYLAVGLSLICLFIFVLAIFAIRNWRIVKKFENLKETPTYK